MAGLVLKGNEVKSIKDGKVNIKGAYVRSVKGEIYIFGMHVSPWKGSTDDETRDRKLLLNSKEIDKLIGLTEQKGMTIVALSIGLSRGLVKLKIAAAKGKKTHDKKDTLSAKAQKRDAEREMKGKIK